MKKNVHSVFYIKPVLIAILMASVVGFSYGRESVAGKNLLQRESELLYNESFSNFVYEFAKNSLDLYAELKNHNCWNAEFANKFIACKSKEEILELCKTNSIDYEAVVNANIYPVAHYVNFLYNNPTYLSADENQQMTAFSSIINKICTDKSFRGANSSAPLVQAISNIFDYGKTKCGNGRFFQLTWDELGGCLISGLGSFIATNISAIRRAWSLLTGNFSLSNVITVLELAFPEFKAAGAIVVTAACIVKEWIW